MAGRLTHCKLLCIYILALAGFTRPGLADSLMDKLSDKTVAEVLDLLESPDPHMRLTAAASIEWRYHKPGGIEINPPTWKKQHPESPLPPQVVPRLAEHLKADPDYVVRIEAARALSTLMYCTNTSALVAIGLDDTNGYVRVWTCSALIDISRDYPAPLNARVVPTLEHCLRVNGPEEPTWIAAWISGRLEDAGRPLLPELNALAKNHRSRKVRHYAHEAVKAIQREKSTTG